MERLGLVYASLGARLTLAKERMKDDAGEGPVSYIAVILLIAIIVAGFAGSGIGKEITNDITAAIKKVFTSGGGS